MEAPEKIYVTKCMLFATNPEITLPKNDKIEYTRTDAFIEKACELLKKIFSFDEAGYCKTNIYSVKSMIYNFKNTLGCKL